MNPGTEKAKEGDRAFQCSDCEGTEISVRVPTVCMCVICGKQWVRGVESVEAFGENLIVQNVRTDRNGVTTLLLSAIKEDIWISIETNHPVLASLPSAIGKIYALAITPIHRG